MKQVVFISHITEDREIAAALRNLLEDKFHNAIDVFVSSDNTSLELGEQWLPRITKALKECIVSIIIAGPEAVQRPWINFEAGAVWLDGLRRVIPLCHSGMEPGKLPWPLKLLQGGLCTDPTALQSMAQAISNKLEWKKVDIDFSDFIDNVRKFEEVSLESKKIADASLLKPIGDLEAHEFEVLLKIANEGIALDDTVYASNIVKEMEENGMTPVFTKLAFNTLRRKALVEFSEVYGYNDGSTWVIKVTDDGWRFLEQNRDKIKAEAKVKTKRSRSRAKAVTDEYASDSGNPDDDIPF